MQICKKKTRNRQRTAFHNHILRLSRPLTELKAPNQTKLKNKKKVIREKRKDWFLSSQVMPLWAGNVREDVQPPASPSPHPYVCLVKQLCYSAKYANIGFFVGVVVALIPSLPHPPEWSSSGAVGSTGSSVGGQHSARPNRVCKAVK